MACVSKTDYKRRLRESPPEIFHTQHLQKTPEKVSSVTSNEPFLGFQALLLGNTIIYERSSDPRLFDQAEVFTHEFIHIQVKTHSAVKCNGRWYKVTVDVPSAALWTYLNLVEKSISKGVNLPDALKQSIDLGRRAFRSNPQKIEVYINNMLAYFRLHDLETNAAYECAAIQAGMILELLGDQQFGKAHNYAQQLTIKPHKEALKSAIAGEKIEL